MAAKFWHMTLVVESMGLMRDFYTRVIGLEETGTRFYEDAKTSSQTPGAIRIPYLKELVGVPWEPKAEEQRYKDEDHDLIVTLIKDHNKPPEEPDRSDISPFIGGHVGFLVDDLLSVLQTMREGQLGKVIITRGPDGAPNHAYISDPEGNAVELQAKQSNE
jgi:catechol 2,3-dioxygenase-like lactoylglutathione lyase family enzyme